MPKLTTILQTPELSTAKTALLGSFAMADFALWYVILCTYFLYINDVSAVRSRSLPHGTSNPHGTRDEASFGRDEGARTGINGLRQTPNQISFAYLINLVILNVASMLFGFS